MVTIGLMCSVFESGSCLSARCCQPSPRIDCPQFSRLSWFLHEGVFALQDTSQKRMRHTRFRSAMWGLGGSYTERYVVSGRGGRGGQRLSGEGAWAREASVQWRPYPPYGTLRFLFRPNVMLPILWPIIGNSPTNTRSPSAANCSIVPHGYEL